MSAEVARQAARDLDPQPAEPAAGARFTALFEAHAAHVFDYCDSLLADAREASSATQATLVTAYALADRLPAADRLRVFLLALARQKCLSGHSVGVVQPQSTWDSAADRPGPPEEADTEVIRLDSAGHEAPAVAAALDAVPAPEREALDLVYRHAVSPADLHAILGISADQASALLAAAVTGFESADQVSADGTKDAAAPDDTASDDTGPDNTAPAARTHGARAAEISVIPLLALPPFLWRRAVSIAVDPELASYRESLGSSLGDFGPDGFAPPEPPPLPARKLVLTSALLGVLLLAPATAGAILVTVFNQPHVLSHAISEVLGQKSSPSLPVPSQAQTPHLPGSALLPKKRAKTTIVPVLPQPHPSSHKPRPSPTTKTSTSTSPFPSSTPTATPTGTPTTTPSGTPTGTPTASPTATPTST